MVSHIGFIMDGNRRYSKQNNLVYEDGYKEGMLQFFNVIKWQVENNISTTSFYALSLDNANKRGKNELEVIKSTIMQLLEDPQFENFCLKNYVKIHLRGRYFKDNAFKKELFEHDVNALINSTQQKFYNNELKNNQGLLTYLENKISSYEENLSNSVSQVDEKFHVNIALFYDGVDEIITTTQNIAGKVQSGELSVEDITKDVFMEESYFSNTQKPQIIVRTGNAPRISGFMLFLSAYTEMYFTPKLWPELTKEDLDNILQWFSDISRNFGK